MQKEGEKGEKRAMFAARERGTGFKSFIGSDRNREKEKVDREKSLFCAHVLHSGREEGEDGLFTRRSASTAGEIAGKAGGALPEWVRCTSSKRGAKGGEKLSVALFDQIYDNTRGIWSKKVEEYQVFRGEGRE